MATLQRIIVELSGENFAVTLRDIENLTYDDFVASIAKKLDKPIPEGSVFACVDQAGRVVRLKGSFGSLERTIEALKLT
jgi:hypothetical protein